MKNMLNIVGDLHTQTYRDYLKRMVPDKIRCMTIAKKFEREYWDGDRKFGYGGYRYIPGRWKVVAEKIINTYKLNNNSSLLDIGCGKGFLLYEIKLILPNLKVTGIDISDHAISTAPQSLSKNLFKHDARFALPFEREQFDLAISLNTFHNFKISELSIALKEIERVAKEKYLVVESYRNEVELFNLQCWALTAEAFFDNSEWVWLMNHFGYTGDYEFIYFE
jgi:ubiquinone/menaquinone biosynthesis C-methylase UbiE